MSYAACFLWRFLPYQMIKSCSCTVVMICSAGHSFLAQHLISLSPVIVIICHSFTGLMLFILCSSLSFPFMTSYFANCKSYFWVKLPLKKIIISTAAYLFVLTAHVGQQKKNACSSTFFLISLTLIGVFIEKCSLRCFRITTSYNTCTYHFSHLLKQYTALLLSLSVHFFIILDDFFRQKLHKWPLCIFIDWPSVHTCFKLLSFPTYVFFYPSLQVYKHVTNSLANLDMLTEPCAYSLSWVKLKLCFGKWENTFFTSSV